MKGELLTGENPDLKCHKDKNTLFFPRTSNIHVQHFLGIIIESNEEQHREIRKRKQKFGLCERKDAHTKEEGEGELTYLLGHSVEEVAVSALLPCPHEARLLSTRRSGAELHGAFSCSLSAAANNANATQTSASAAAALTTGGDAHANASCAGGSATLSWRWPRRRLRVLAGLWGDRVTLSVFHIQLCLLGLRGKGDTGREGRRDVGVRRRREEKEVSEGGFFWGRAGFFHLVFKGG